MDDHIMKSSEFQRRFFDRYKEKLSDGINQIFFQHRFSRSVHRQNWESK